MSDIISLAPTKVGVKRLGEKKNADRTEGGAPSELVMSAAEIREMIRSEIYRTLPQPMDASLSSELRSMIEPLIDQIVSECQSNPKNADNIISTAVSSMVSQVRREAQRTTERTEDMRERTSGNSKNKKKPKKRVVFKHDASRSELGLDETLSDEDHLQVERSIQELLDEQTLPENVQYVSMDGIGYWRVALEESAERFVMIPASNIRMVSVAVHASGQYRIVEMSAPIMTFGLDAAGNRTSTIGFSSRELIWGEEQIKEAVGDFDDLEELTQRLREQETMQRLWQAFHEEQQRARAQLEAVIQQEMDVLSQRMQVENVAQMPLHFAPTEMPEDVMMALDHIKALRQSMMA